MRDERVARVANIVLRPGWLSLSLLLIRSREGFDVGATIEALTLVPPPPLSVVEERVRDDRVR